MATIFNAEDYLETLRGLIKTRTRLNKLDEEIPAPSATEMNEAIFAALDEINSHEPRTNFTLEYAFKSAPDTRLQTILILGASKNLLETLLYDYTANGDDASIDVISVQSRLSDFNGLYSTIKSSFDERLEKYKRTATKRIKAGFYQTAPQSAGTKLTTTYALRLASFYKGYRV